jgi:hypothetical protein
MSECIIAGCADFVQTAITVAKAMGRPAKVIWSREEDFRYDPYRPPMTHAVRDTLGGDGLPIAMAQRVVSPLHILYILPRNAARKAYRRARACGGPGSAGLSTRAGRRDDRAQAVLKASPR